MQTATPVTPTKKDIRKRCESCSKKFTPQRTTQKYCSSDCRVSGNNSTRRTMIKRDYTVPISAPFCCYMIRECQRAGTVQILAEHTVESLTELYHLHTYRYRANMFKSFDDDHQNSYQLSHIIPVHGTNQLGLLHAENLVVALASENKQHGAKWFGYGKGIPRTSIRSKWDVQPNTSREDVFKLMTKIVGTVKLTQFAKAVKLKPSKRQEHIEYLSAELKIDMPEHATHLKALSNKSTTTQALGAIVAELKGKKVSTFKRECDYFSPFRVFRDELFRCTKYRPDLTDVHALLCEVTAIEWARHHEEPKLQSWEVAALFDILHGREVSHFIELLADMKARHMAWSTDLILKYEPRAFNFTFDPTDSAVPTIQPISVYQSFADELDFVSDEVVPVLLPWMAGTYQEANLTASF